MRVFASWNLSISCTKFTIKLHRNFEGSATVCRVKPRDISHPHYQWGLDLIINSEQCLDLGSCSLFPCGPRPPHWRHIDLRIFSGTLNTRDNYLCIPFPFVRSRKWHNNPLLDSLNCLILLPCNKRSCHHCIDPCPAQMSVVIMCAWPYESRTAFVRWRLQFREAMMAINRNAHGAVDVGTLVSPRSVNVSLQKNHEFNWLRNKLMRGAYNQQIPGTRPPYVCFWYMCAHANFCAFAEP